MGSTQTKIADYIGVDKSTIGRELKRNIPKRGQTAGLYIGKHARRKTDHRHSSKANQILLTDSLKLRIKGLMSYGKWSPELIAKRLSKESQGCVGHGTIYKWIWMAKKSNHRDHSDYKSPYGHLSHTGRRQKRNNVKDRHGAIKGRVAIDKRPVVVEARPRVVDIEVDLVMGSNHRSALLVMTDRAIPITMIGKPKSKNAGEVHQKMRSRLTDFNSCWIKTITFDTGKGFAHHHKISEDLNVKTYFTRPYTFRDKGTVENRIGVIGRFFPKKQT